MMTCVSERSGIASSGTCRTAQTAPTIAAPVRTRTRNRFRALNSMMRSTMVAPSADLGRGRRAERRERRAEARLRVDQEVRRRDDALARLDAPEHLVVPVCLAPELHRARLEPPVPGQHEDDLAFP